MNEQQVERENVIERFVSGNLSQQEEAEFEEFLFEHPEYLDEVQWARDLGQSLRSVASREGTHTAPLGPISWLVTRSRMQQTALLAAMLTILLLPSAFLALQQPTSPLPQANTPVVFLGTSRSADSTQGPAVNLGAEPHWIVLSLDLPIPLHSTYRADLLDPRGRISWRFEGLAPSRQETLTVSLHTSFLQPGSYSLRVESLADGRADHIGVFPFQIVSRD